MKRALVATGAVLLWSGLSALRIVPELRHAVKSDQSNIIVGSAWDPRDGELLEHLVRQRESESFHDRLTRGVAKGFSWPGLANAQVSWTWLELLVGLHNPESFEGDFSWMFSKLNTVIKNSPDEEKRFVGTLAPFFFVIGHDHVGANILMDEMIRRTPESYNTWFWSGFHAMENLQIRPLAADLLEHASKMPRAPDYLAALVLRLKLGEEFLSAQNKKEIIEKTVEPALIDKIKRARPAWFEN